MLNRFVKLRRNRILPLFTDLIDENVRNRYFFAAVILILYVLVAFTFLAAEKDLLLGPSSIEIEINTAKNYLIGNILSSSSLTPRIKAVNKYVL